MEMLGDWGYWGLFLGSFLASTVMPFSSDALLIGAILAGGELRLVLIYATVGNFLGGLTTYYIGYLGRWEWIERYLGVSREKLERQSEKIKKYGSLIALMSWVPIVGDVVTVALGFYRVNFITSSIYMFIGRAARFVAWAVIFAPR
ncbi:MAG: YqaA family protein [Rikenellaceae bacterium]